LFHSLFLFAVSPAVKPAWGFPLPLCFYIELSGSIPMLARLVAHSSDARYFNHLRLLRTSQTIRFRRVESGVQIVLLLDLFQALQ
jgi:hypothetical protein